MTANETSSRVLQLHAQGMGRNEISRQVGCCRDTVSKIVAGAGLTFERSDSIVRATKARQVDLSVRRQEVAERILDQLDVMLSRLESPKDWETVLRSPGGQQAARPGFIPAGDMQAAWRAVADATSSLTRLDLGEGSTQVTVSLVTGLAEQLGVSDEGHTL